MLVVELDSIYRRLVCFSAGCAIVLGSSLAASGQDAPSAEDTAEPGSAQQSATTDSDETPSANPQSEPSPEVPPIEVTQPAKPKPAAPRPTAKPATASRPAPSVPSAPPQPVLDVVSTPGVIGETGDGGSDSYLAATGPVDGYVATSSATATKTGTPLIETPQSISVITADQMEAQAVENLAQALRYTPGVTGELFGLDNRCYGLMIRGFKDFDDSVYYRDGLQLSGTGLASFCTLDPYGAERIEVLRGPASVLYGQGEPGGIINYISKRPTDEPFHEVEVGIGNFDHYEARFDISDKVSPDGKLTYRLTGIGIDSSTQIDFVDYDRAFIAPSFTWTPNADTTLTVLTNYQYDNTGWTIQFYPAVGTVLPNPHGRVPSSRFTGEPKFDYYKLEQYAFGYLFEHRFNETWTVRQNARYAHLYNKQAGVFGSGLEADLRTYTRYGDTGESKLGTFAIDNQAQAEFVTGPIGHTMLFGIDYQDYSYGDLGTYAVVPSIDIFDPVYGAAIPPLPVYTDTDLDQTQLGFYLQDQIKLGEKWTAVLGGRRDQADVDSSDRATGVRTEQEDDAWTGRVGLVYLSDTGLAPYVSYAESFLPTLGVDVFGTPFDPTTSQAYEVGVKYQPPGLQNAFVTFAAFDITRQNILTLDPNNPLNQVQTGEVNSRGIEVEAVASLDWGLDLHGAYTFLDVEITSSNDGTVGNTPYGVPTHMASLWADYTMQRGRLAGFGFGGGVRYIGETWGDDVNTFKVPSATLFDAAIHYEWKNYRLAVNAQNVFDKEYIASCFTFEFGCTYGERRQILGTLSYRW